MPIRMNDDTLAQHASGQSLAEPDFATPFHAGKTHGETHDGETHERGEQSA